MTDKIKRGAWLSSKIMMRITAVAHGRVQGVGYRYFVTDCARKAGLSGFVKNMPDGSVLMVAEGGQEALDLFFKTGPGF
ncbi:MAG TPA: acylphosphatase [Methanoregula sp.]|nr:acylphosphatase [Methanoregula sp.]